MSVDRRRTAATFLIALGLALVAWARIAEVNRLIDQGWLVTYDELASRILRGTVPRGDLGGISAAYLWLVTLLRGVGLPLLAIRDLQIAAVSLAALLCGLAAKRYGGWPAALAAAVFVLGNRAAVIVATELDPGTVLLVLFAAALLAWPGRPWLAGLLLGAAAVTHPVGFAILLLFLAAQPGPRRPLLLGAAIPVALVLAVNLAVAGRPLVFRGGNAFYEGNNPRSPGCGGATPRVVADVQASTKHPTTDSIYRAIAVDAGGGAWYWPGRSLAFAEAHPLAELQRLGWKAVLTVHHFDVHDVLTSNRKDVEMARAPSIPFGLLVALAAAALALRRERRQLLPALLVALALMGWMTLFLVNARERDPLLAPMAILAGCGVAEIVRLGRAKNERALFAFGAVIIATALLGIEGRPMREHRYKWWTAFGLERKMLEPEAPPRLFDAALGMQGDGDWKTSEAALASIADYRPLRANRAVSSVAYQRARAALRLGVPPTHVRELLDRAAREAPGDPDVLALRAVTFEPEAAGELDALHDPFTRDFALALAFADVGQTDRAARLLEGLVRRLPEWPRPRAARHALRTTGGKGGSGIRR